MKTLQTLIPTIAAASLAQSVLAADLAPSAWPKDERLAAEKAEATSMVSRQSRVYSGRNGVISAIASPIAVAAGLQALRQGGTAADAATAVRNAGQWSEGGVCFHRAELGRRGILATPPA